MATHSSILAWRIPGTEEPSGLPSMGSQSWTRLKRLSSSSSSSMKITLWMKAQQEGALTPPSSRAEGLIFLHGLETNHESTLQTEEEAGLP